MQSSSRWPLSLAHQRPPSPAIVVIIASSRPLPVSVRPCLPSMLFARRRRSAAALACRCCRCCRTCRHHPAVAFTIPSTSVGHQAVFSPQKPPKAPKSPQKPLGITTFKEIHTEKKQKRHKKSFFIYYSFQID